MVRFSCTSAPTSCYATAFLLHSWWMGQKDAPRLEEYVWACVSLQPSWQPPGRSCHNGKQKRMIKNTFYDSTSARHEQFMKTMVYTWTAKNSNSTNLKEHTRSKTSFTMGESWPSCKYPLILAPRNSLLDEKCSKTQVLCSWHVQQWSTPAGSLLAPVPSLPVSYLVYFNSLAYFSLVR